MTGQFPATAGRSEFSRQRGDAFPVDRPYGELDALRVEAIRQTAGFPRHCRRCRRRTDSRRPNRGARAATDRRAAAQASNVSRSFGRFISASQRTELLWTHADEIALARASLFTRRIAYHDRDNWHPHIWDQGSLRHQDRAGKTTRRRRLFRFDVCDYRTSSSMHNPVRFVRLPTERRTGDGACVVDYPRKIMERAVPIYSLSKSIQSQDRSQYSTETKRRQTAHGSDRKTSSSRNPLYKPWATEFARSGDSRQHRAGAFQTRGDERSGGTSDSKTFVEWCDNQIARTIRDDGRGSGYNRTALDRRWDVRQARTAWRFMTR